MRIYRTIPIILQAIIYTVTRLLFSVFAGLEIRGREHLESVSRNAIFAANHASEWDGPLLRSSLPFFSRFSPMYYVARSQKYYLDFGWRGRLYGGLLFRLLGAYPAYAGKQDYTYSLQHHIDIVSGGNPLCIFPEGRKSPDGSFGAAHGGVAFLAKRCHAPVVPVAISGLVAFSFLELLQGKRKVTVTFGEPLSASDIISEENPEPWMYKEGAKKVMSAVQALLSRS